MGITLRQTLNRPLTWAEGDANFTYLLTNMSGSNVAITGSAVGIIGNTIKLTGPTTVTGSLNMTGSLSVTGSINVVGSNVIMQANTSIRLITPNLELSGIDVVSTDSFTLQGYISVQINGTGSYIPYYQ